MTKGTLPIESTSQWTLIDLAAVVEARLDQSSYHVFSEESVRGEIFNLRKGQQLGPFKSDGNVLLIPLRGSLEVFADAQVRTISVGSQLLINSGVKLSCKAQESSSLEVIWAPPFSKTQQFPAAHEA